MKTLVRSLAGVAGLAAASYATYVGTAWLRYGRPRRATGPERDELLDRFMPEYEVAERHHRYVAAPPEVTLASASAMRLDDSRIVRAIFRGRELIMRSRPEPNTRTGGLVDEMTAIGWSVLAQTPRALVLGAATKPWEANPVFRPIPAESFAAFAEPDHVKIVWTLRADPAGDGGTTFRTETRAVATDVGARRKFRWYWAFLSPGILVIRHAMLGSVERAAMRAWHLEGDDLLPDARVQLDHAITIDAPARAVWPWLLQMGCQRGGWYSWDRLDNAGRRSATTIIPELQHLEVGDVLPWRPTDDEGFEVVRVVPERALILHSKTPVFEGTWAFVLEPAGPDGRATRLVTRYRASYPPSPRMSIMVPMMRAVHAIMERKQLRTLKHHAEHRHAS